MRVFPFLLLSLVLGLPSQAAENGVPALKQIAPDNEHFAYMGRVRLSEQKAQMGFPGVTVRFVYRGPAAWTSASSVTSGE
jgi:hypothetical protein